MRTDTKKRHVLEHSIISSAQSKPLVICIIQERRCQHVRLCRKLRQLFVAPKFWLNGPDSCHNSDTPNCPGFACQRRGFSYSLGHFNDMGYSNPHGIGHLLQV